MQTLYISLALVMWPTKHVFKAAKLFQYNGTDTAKTLEAQSTATC